MQIANAAKSTQRGRPRFTCSNAKRSPNTIHVASRIHPSFLRKRICPDCIEHHPAIRAKLASGRLWRDMTHGTKALWSFYRRRCRGSRLSDRKIGDRMGRRFRNSSELAAALEAHTRIQRPGPGSRRLSNLGKPGVAKLNPKVVRMSVLRMVASLIVASMLFRSRIVARYLGLRPPNSLHWRLEVRPMKLILLAAVSTFLLVVGFCCITRPQSVQRLALRTMPNAGSWPTRDWVRSSSYLISVRMCGVLALGVGILLLWILMQEIHL
jgi:hypothetical protein